MAAVQAAQLGYAPVSTQTGQTTSPEPTVSPRWWQHPFAAPPFPLPDGISEATIPIGVSWDAGDGPLQKAVLGDKWDKERIRVYGWLDFGYTASTSNHNNFPLSYDIMPNRPVLDQGVLRFERTPDTVQQDHNDWGFRFSSLYGIDYRFTAGDGYFFDQLQKHNMLYGYDPVEMYFQYYWPRFGGLGSYVQVGRYISPCDIEEQLSPDNYLFSHSLMYTVDPYTYSGAYLVTQYSKYWSTIFGFDAGNDKAWWEKSAEPNGEALVSWHSHTNNDVLMGGVDQFGNGHFSWGHDSEQIATINWQHKWSNAWHVISQYYYMWEYDAAKGGTEVDGPSEPYASGGGSGPIMPGQSHANGYVTYLEHQTDKWSYLTFRTDWLNDPDGWRTGYNNNYYSLTIGYARWLSPTTEFRPELRHEWADNPAYDNGAHRAQTELAADLIFHF